MNEKVKKPFFKRFLMILLLIIVVYFVWFLIHNFIIIRNGRTLSHEEIVKNEYVSNDMEIKLKIVDEDSIQIKILIDEDKGIYYFDVLNYQYKEGSLVSEKTIVKDKEKEFEFIFLNKEEIYFYTFNKYLFLES